jgi:hypothetical protein
VIAYNLEEGRQFLAGKTPGIVMYHGKMRMFDKRTANLDTESGGSHPMSDKSLDGNKSAYANLNNDLLAESEQKPAITGREE